jgi:tol-pal system protein YbgF
LQSDLRNVRDELEELKRSQAAQRVQFDELRNRFVVMEDKADTQRMNRASREDKASRDDNTWIPKLPTVKVQKPQEVAQVEREPAAPSGPADDLPPQDEPRPRADDPATQYQSAKTAYDHGDMAVARAMFEQLYKQWPKHDLADNALFWLGESYRSESLWLKAAQYYLRVAKEYPKENKVPDALLQLGHCYTKLGEDESAAEVWRQLVHKFPAEPAAKTARMRLAELKGNAS